MLTLPIKKKWFDMIVSGEKKEEYREITPYYTKRFNNNLSRQCILRNGYSSDSPALLIDYKIDIGYGKTEWGAEKGNLCYRLHILKVCNMEDSKCQQSD